METTETRAKLANAIRQLQTTGDNATIIRLVSAYKAKYQTGVASSSSISPSFKATVGGASSILPNVSKTVGNLPSNVAGLIQESVGAPIEKTKKSIGLLNDIYKEQGYAQGSANIGEGIADTVKNIFKAPGEAIVASADKQKLVKTLAPIQEQTQKQKEEIVQKIIKAHKTGEDTTRLISALKSTQETLDSLNEKIGTKEERNLKDVETSTNIAKYPIERPLDIPLALYGGENSITGTDAITDLSSPITRGADTSFANISNKTGNLVKNSLNDIIKTKQPQAINELEQTYNEIMSGTTPGKKKLSKIGVKTEALNNAGTQGKTPMRTLAEDGVIPNQSGTKLDTFEQAQQYKQNIIPLKNANKTALKEVGLSTAPVKLSDLEIRAIEYARTPENINAGRFDKMKSDIVKEFNSLRRNYPGGSIPLSTVDDIKAARWDNVFKNKGLVEADVLKKNSEYAIAKSLQKTIEEIASKAGNPDVAQLNRAIGDRLEAAKFLEDINGKTVKGGRLLKYMTTGIGASFGHSVPGKIIGALGGNLVGDLILSNSIASPVKRFILKSFLTTNPEAYTKTLQWLEKQNLDRETRLLLAPGNKNSNLKINQGRPIPVAEKNNKIDYLGTETMAQSKSPTNQQTINATAKTSSTPKSTTKFPNKQGGFINFSAIAKSIDNVDRDIMKSFVDLVNRGKTPTKDILLKAQQLANAMQLESKFDTNKKLANDFNKILEIDRQNLKK